MVGLFCRVRLESLLCVASYSTSKKCLSPTVFREMTPAYILGIEIVHLKSLSGQRECRAMLAMLSFQLLQIRIPWRFVAIGKRVDYHHLLPSRTHIQPNLACGFALMGVGLDFILIQGFNHPLTFKNFSFISSTVLISRSVNT